MRKKITIFLLLVYLLIVVLIAQVTYAIDDFDYGSKEFQEIVSRLYMQGHADHDISTCSIKTTYYKEIAEMMQQGNTKEQIISYYVEQYGESALKAPGTKGFSLMAWVAPFLAILIATIIISLVVRNWVHKNRNQQSIILDVEATVTPTIEETTRLKIDEERKKYL